MKDHFAPREPRIVLASASPRRRELLARIVSCFEVMVPRVDETELAMHGTPERYASDLARAKAHEVGRLESGIIIGADTLVVLDGEILGKPRDRDESRTMLERLSGRDHCVLTGLCVLDSAIGAEAVACESTVVRFRPLTAREIAEYIDSGEPDDKAGAYAIQGRGAVFVREICGDYYNVVGLPLCRLYLMLTECGGIPSRWSERSAASER